MPKIAVTAIVGLSYLSLHPSLFSMQIAGLSSCLTAYDFTSRGRSRVWGNKESMELGMGDAVQVGKLALAYSIGSDSLGFLAGVLGISQAPRTSRSYRS